MAVYYATATELRSELGVSSGTLSDPAAEKLIESAEDRMDALLGNYPIDTTTGRKIVLANVPAWQWAKLKRATIKNAAVEYSDANAFKETRWDNVSGPDFSVSGPKGTAGAAASAESIRILNASGLRIMGAMAKP